MNGLPAARAHDRPSFDALTPLYADDRLRLEDGSASATARIIDLVGPIGRGQRGLIVSPPKAGKTMLLKEIAAAIAHAYPEVHLMMVLVGERPEEVTDIRRSVHGEVVFSTFDHNAQDHILVAELAIERAKRLVELGRDVVVLLDSITRLARAYNVVAPASSRILAGGVAASALQPPRKFLGAARNLEHGGSLTILSTALIETGSRMDDVFFEEFKGTGNMELRLRRDLAEKRLYPAIDVTASGTRRDDLLMAPDEYAAVGKLRRGLSGLDAQQGLELLLERTRDTSSNAEFLRQVQGADTYTSPLTAAPLTAVPPTRPGAAPADRPRPTGPLAHPPRAELHADPRPHRPRRLRHGVLPGPLAAAAHDQKITVPEFVAQPRPAPARPQQQRPRRAQRNDRDHRVLPAPPADGVAVPGHAVPAVPVQAQPGGRERLAQLGLVVRVQRPARLVQRRIGQRLLLAVEAKQPRDVDHPVVHWPALGAPRHI